MQCYQLQSTGDKTEDAEKLNNLPKVTQAKNRDLGFTAGYLPPETWFLTTGILFLTARTSCEKGFK